MPRKFNLADRAARKRHERRKARAADDRAQFLSHWSEALMSDEFKLLPTSAVERTQVVESENGYAYAQYTTLARLEVPFDCGGGKHRRARRVLPDIVEVTEIVYSSHELDDVE